MNINKNIFETEILELKILFVHEDANIILEKIAYDIKNIAKVVLGVSTRKAPNSKNS